MAEQAEGSFMVASIEHEVSTDVTEYALTCVTRNDLIAQGVLNTTDLLNVIGYEPVIQSGHEAYVHHYVVKGYTQETCTDDFMAEMVYVWAPGEGPMSLPSFLGAPMFGDDGFNAFEIEVHYNNAQRTSGIIDNSGVRIYWTSELRDEQVGILSTGDPNVGLYGQAVGNGQSLHSFECPGSCSTLIGKEVTVLREYLHMHQTGARMTNEQIRNGSVIRKAEIDYWEFQQNGNAAMQQDPYTVMPGDGFKTSCYFDGNDRVFGLASAEEMCMTFLYYYPRAKIRIEQMDLEFPWTCGYGIGFEPCETSYEMELLTGAEEFHREFGISSGDQCNTEDNVSAGDSTGDIADGQNSSAVTIIASISTIVSVALSFLL
jgi:hypothetical protein